MDQVVLVDFSHFANMCWFPALSAQEADPEKYDAKQVLRTNLRLKLQSLRFDIPVDPNEFIFVVESRPEAKFELYPKYKANRTHGDFDFKPLAMAYLKKEAPNATWSYAPGHEADDAIATIATAHSRQGADVVVVSGDKDLWALMSAKVSIYNPIKKAFVTVADVEKAFGLSDPTRITLHKSLWGDAGDNVPNAAPRMQKALMPIINECDGSLGDFFLKVEKANVSGRCRELLTTGRRQIEVNYELVMLSRDAEIDWLD